MSLVSTKEVHRSELSVKVSGVVSVSGVDGGNEIRGMEEKTVSMNL